MSIFNSKKVWIFLIKIQLTKSDPKEQGDKSIPPSCQLGLIGAIFYLSILGHCVNTVRRKRRKTHISELTVFAL
jgi:hypothetical protein